MKFSINKDMIAEIYASDDMDNHPEQLKRIKSAQSAKTTPSSIDRENRTGIFPGSGKKPYETTLQSCTCRDFIVRGLPCKHIYRLKIELGLLDVYFYKGMNKNYELANELTFEEVIAELEKLTENNQKTIQSFLCNALYHKELYLPIIIDNETAELLTCPLLKTETQDLPEYALRIFGRNQLIYILDEHDISGFKRNSSQKNLILWCIENVPDIWAVFPKVTLLRFADSFQKARCQTYKYLLRKYDWDSYYIEKETIDHMIEIRYPHGAAPENLSFSISPNGNVTSYGNPNIYHFPNDEITELLTLYGHNRCLNGFDVTPQELE